MNQSVWLAYIKTLAVCAAVTLLSALLPDDIELTNIAMLFLLAVVVVAVYLGRGPALAAAVMGVAAFDFFFVPPRYTFAVNEAKYILTFVVMFIVALIVGQLMARFRQSAEVSRLREARAIALYGLARELSAAIMLDQVHLACLRFLSNEFDAQAALLVLDSENRLQLISGDATSVNRGISFDADKAGTAFASGQPDHSDASRIYLPLKAPMRVRGVIVIHPQDIEIIQQVEGQRQLDTFASLVAIALERLHYVEVAQDSTVQIETERLRNSLLATISHDLRTPLSALVGLAESMALTKPLPTGPQAAIAHSIVDMCRRMSTQVNNLLEMAKLQAGKVQLNRQWQPVEEVIGSALESSKTLVASHPVQIDIPEDFPLVEIDSILIERALSNILENAAKYTASATEIRISAVVNQDDIEVRIEDAGPGIPKDREHLIFEKFERGDPEGTTTGVGLGLAICQAIVTAHGGNLRMDRSSLGGACFVITLPLGVPPELPLHDSIMQANP